MKNKVCVLLLCVAEIIALLYSQTPCSDIVCASQTENMTEYLVESRISHEVPSQIVESEISYENSSQIVESEISYENSSQIIESEISYENSSQIVESEISYENSSQIIESEISYEVPSQITDDIKTDDPSEEISEMSEDQRMALLRTMFYANGPENLWENHQDVSITFRQFNTDTQSWAEYCRTYADLNLWYSDDWTSGYEELRRLVSGSDQCVEDYMSSMRFVKFLDCSGNGYRSVYEDAVTIGESTMDETLLDVTYLNGCEYVSTKLTDSEVLSMGLAPSEEGGFYSCLYVLDENSQEVHTVQITLHNKDGSRLDARNITFSYDNGMDELISTGAEDLRRHLYASQYWDTSDLRSVTVTVDPGTPDAMAFTTLALKGDIVSVTLPKGYALYSDSELATVWIDDGEYTKDMILWAGPEEAETQTATESIDTTEVESSEVNP